METVILLSGKAESGKTTLTKEIKKMYTKKGMRVITPSFGNYVKFICKAYFGWDGNKDESGREILQRIGTDIVRNKMADFWSRSVLQLLYVLEEEFDVAIIDDVRFKNEIEIFLKESEYSCFTIRVERPDHVSSLTDIQKAHISETELDDYSLFDYYALNKEGLENVGILSKEIFEALTELGY